MPTIKQSLLIIKIEKEKTTVSGDFYQMARGGFELAKPRAYESPVFTQGFSY